MKAQAKTRFQSRKVSRKRTLLKRQNSANEFNSLLELHKLEQILINMNPII